MTFEPKTPKLSSNLTTGAFILLFDKIVDNIDSTIHCMTGKVKIFP